MAERRMFAKKITESDAFLDMPSSTQALYFHLNMSADDDGFVNNPRKIQRMVGSSDDDFKLLIAKSFVITFDSGIIVIKHWKMHNYIQKDRYKPTDYIEEKSMLELKKNKAYTLNVSKTDTESIQDVPVGKVRLGKVSLGKVNNNVQQDCTPKVTKTDIDNFFESIWKLYPNKKGKGQISDSKKKVLYSFGYETLEKCIERYKVELEKDKDWRKPQNGSTFFNSGYIDYLDGDYEPGKASNKPNTNKFNNFQQRERTKEDIEKLERQLLGLE